MKLNRLNKRIVNDLKVTDHHGILITDDKTIGFISQERGNLRK
jgi:hypothetical protein